LEGGALLYRGRELSQGFTQKEIFRLRKKLAKIDEGVPSEWLTNTSPALLERLSGSTWDVSAIIELIEQYEGGGNSDG
jgi:hypothetical protein